MSNVKGFRQKKAPTKSELAQADNQLKESVAGLLQANKFLSQNMFRMMQDINHQTREVAALTELVGTRAVEGNLKEGDIAIINFVGTVDGVLFDGGYSKKTAVRLGSGNFIPGFEEALVGKTISSELHEITVTFPDNYQAKPLAGKEAVFHVQVVEAFRDAADSTNFDAKVDELMKIKEEKEKADAKKQEQDSQEAEQTSENQEQQQEEAEQQS